MIEVRGCFKVVPHELVGDDPVKLSKHLDRVMDQVVVLQGVLDAAVEADLQAGEVWITVTVDGTDLDDGSTRGMAAIRTAIHAAGGATRGWRDALVETGRQSELVGG